MEVLLYFNSEMCITRVESDNPEHHKFVGKSIIAIACQMTGEGYELKYDTGSLVCFHDVHKPDKGDWL